MKDKLHVSVVGLGYIGLPTAAFFASKGLRVFGFDLNPTVVNGINDGKSHITEPKLENLIRTCVEQGNLSAHNSLQVADVYMVCVPTPVKMNGSNVSPDLRFVYQAFEDLSNVLKPQDMVILESTCPIGSTERLVENLSNANIDLSQIHIAYCPERVLPGRILEELYNNDRIVGGVTPLATEKVSNFYRNFIAGCVHETDCKTAEMCKLIENSYRDVNIAFANEVSRIADGLGISGLKVVELANRHPRVNILSPGIGVGGHCLAIDPWFLVDVDSDNSKTIREARISNELQPSFVAEKIKSFARSNFSHFSGKCKIALFGLSYKPDIDDLREAPAIKIIKILKEFDFELLLVEPHLSQHPDFKLSSIEDALVQCDFGVILVNHSIFHQKDIFSHPKCRNELRFFER